MLGLDYRQSSPEEAYLVFKRFDSDQDGKLSYEEFCEMFAPKDKYLGEKVLNQRSYYLSLKTLDLIKRVLKAHLNVEQAHEYIRARLKK